MDGFRVVFVLSEIDKFAKLGLVVGRNFGGFRVVAFELLVSFILNFVS